MAVKKSRAPKKKPPRKKKPKVKLDGKRVMALAAGIVFLSAAFLSVSIIFSRPGKSRGEKKPGPAAVEKKSAERVELIQQEPEPSPIPPEKKKPGRNPEPKANPPEPERIPARDEPKKNPGPQKKQETPAEPKPESKPAEQPKIASAAPPAKKPVENPPEKYRIPQASNGATIMFVIDDAGLTTANIRRYTSLPFPVAIAVLPKLPHSRDCAKIVRDSGQELMLHQPMQAQNLAMNPGAGAIKPDMTLSEIYNQVMENLSEIGPGVKGMNNHEGSLISCDEMKIGAVLDAALESRIYFLDSRTTKDTTAPRAALERDMKIHERDVFIDDVISRDEMLRQIYRGIGIANKKGKVIMIGHVDKSAKILPELLSDMYPHLKAKGYRITTPGKFKL